MNTAKIAFLVAAALFLLMAGWWHLGFPVYDERRVGIMIERSVPVGAERAQVTGFLDALVKHDLHYEAHDNTVTACFPATKFQMRDKRCVEAVFVFSDGKMSRYELRRVAR